MEGTIESKAYARSENKDGVARTLLDGMYAEGKFTRDQLEDLYQNVVCVECEKCGKSRILPPGVFPPEDDEQWECRMNFDQAHNSCDIAEETGYDTVKNLTRVWMRIRS